MEERWLITGGAGFIGAHIADELLANGKELIIYDSLFHGLESRISYLRKKYKREIPLIVADIRDSRTFRETLNRHKPKGIIHTAALKSVNDSMEKSDEYFDVNCYATVKLLDIAQSEGVTNFIFSSTAAVYGAPNHLNLIEEDHIKNPISPYGESKFAAEVEVNKFLSKPGNFGTALRFFNVIGSASPELMDNSLENLVPIVISKLQAKQSPVIFGTDYPTIDGTCIRDYVDVRDIARAHLAVINSGKKLPQAMNVGTGFGQSVRTVIGLIITKAGYADVLVGEAGRRLGDPSFLCADVSLIKSTLGFTAKYSLESSIESLF